MAVDAVQRGGELSTGTCTSIMHSGGTCNGAHSRHNDCGYSVCPQARVMAVIAIVAQYAGKKRFVKPQHHNAFMLLGAVLMLSQPINK